MYIAYIFFKCKLILTIKSQIMKDFEAEISLHYSCTIFIPLCIRAVTQTNPNTDFVVFIGRHIFGENDHNIYLSLMVFSFLYWERFQMFSGLWNWQTH